MKVLNLIALDMFRRAEHVEEPSLASFVGEEEEMNLFLEGKKVLSTGALRIGNTNTLISAKEFVRYCEYFLYSQPMHIG